MFDLREYKETIKAAVLREREDDENWSWSVKSVGKTKAKIGWGYLDYIGEKELFEVEIEELEEYDPCVIGKMPNGQKMYAFVGPNRWDDADTVEAGIARVIHAMASSAHNTY